MGTQSRKSAATGPLRAIRVPFYFRCRRAELNVITFQPLPFLLTSSPPCRIVPSSRAGQRLPEGSWWQQALSPHIPSPLVQKLQSLLKGEVGCGSLDCIVMTTWGFTSSVYLQRLKDNCWELERMRGGGGSPDSSGSSMLSHHFMGLARLRGGCVLCWYRLRRRVAGHLL